MTETTTQRTSAAAVQLWQCLAFHDADRMMEWLGAIGFVAHSTFRDDDGNVVHAEWLWPEGGGIMFGSERADSPLHEPGKAGTYLVTGNPDRVFEAAVAAGATVQRPMVDHDYGGRGGSVLDPEGNHWSFGSYQPA
ncbi:MULTISPECIES: VOC family protein [Nocardioides]|uniref:VOC family protein n=1 Tax=Nocardioides vastitatis TaxID=2568655 RepID=A0ABW0ZKE2_9ACTN|nr:VOC family protein [Nocardioides sp.]THJ03056.1 glyoxalase [Nocardioides sp.]